ncbi:MAG: exosortase A [Pseudomonadota bacterium]
MSTAETQAAPKSAADLKRFAEPPWRAHVAAAGTLSLAVFALYAPTWASMVSVWTHSVTYNLDFFVMPIAAFLVWLRRDLLLTATPRFEPLAVVPALGFGCLWVLGHAGYVQLFEHAGVVGMLVSAIVGCIGRQAARVLAFPIAFLFFMVPFGDEFIPMLQNVTADFTVALMRAFGFAIYRDGIFLQTTGGRFQVAEACAGVRFLVANVMIAALVSHLSFDRWWKHGTFMVVAVATPIVANGFRAFGIVLIATLTNGEVATGVDHLVYGWGFFAAIMLFLIWAGTSFADRRVGDPPATLALPPLPGRSAEGRVVVGVLAAATLAAGLYGFGVVDRAGGAAVATLDGPPALEAGIERAETFPEWTAQAPEADASALTAYRLDGVHITVHQAVFERERPGKELVHNRNRAYDGEIWYRVSTITRTMEAGGRATPVRIDVLDGPTGRLAAATVYRVDGTYFGDAKRVKLQQALGRLTGRAAPGHLFTLATPVDGRNPRDLEAAVAALMTTTPVLLDARNGA